MRSTRFALLCVGTVLFAACDEGSDVIVAPEVPQALTRFINVVPDTVATDWRFIDQLEGSPVELALAFRGFSPYQGTAPGARPLRIFPATTDVSTQFHFVDQTLTLEADRRYSLIHVGMTRASQAPEDQLLVIEDVIPTVATDAIAVRVVNAGVGLGAIDVYMSTAGGAAPLPATATFTNVAYGTATDYTSRTPQPKTTFISMATTTTGYSRPTGSFIADGFVVGQQITAAGFAATANNGRSVITAVTDPKTTGAVSLSATSTGYARTTGSFVTDGFVPGMWITATGFGGAENNTRALVTAVTATNLTVGHTTGSTDLSATANGYARPVGGSFIADGFYIGMPITASGFTNSANNGASVITAMTATSLTVAKTPATAVEAAAAGRTISRQPTPVQENEAAGRTITSDASLTVTKSSGNTPEVSSSASRSIGAELVLRATATGTTTPILAEWTAPLGEVGNVTANLEPIGGNTMGGSAMTAIFVPRSVAGSRAPQAGPTNNPPTPGFLIPTWVFAVDKHPR